MAERVTRPAELGRLGSHLRGRPRNGTFLAWDREDDGLDLSALGFWRALRAPRLCLQGLGSGCTERSVGQRLRRAGCGGHGGPSEPGNTPWLPPRSALALARFQVRQAEGLRLPCRAGPSCGGLRRAVSGPGRAGVLVAVPPSALHLPGVSLLSLTLTNSQTLLQQNGFIWKKQSIAIPDMCNDKPHTNPKKQRRPAFFYGLGRGCPKPRVHWRNPNIGSIVASHWLRFGSLSLAELLPGRGLFFLLLR